MRLAFLAGFVLALSVSSAGAVQGSSAVPATGNGQAFLASGAVQRRLSRLIGPGNYSLLLSNFKRVGTLQNDAHVTAFIGCQDNGCGINDALVVYARDTDSFRVMLHHDERPAQFQERGGSGSARYNMALKSAVVNFGL